MNTMAKLRNVAPGYDRFKTALEVHNAVIGLEQQRRAEKRMKNITIGVGVFVAFCIGSILLMSV